MANSLSVPAILTVAGIVLLVFAIIGTILFPKLDSPLHLPGRARIGLGILGLFTVVLGLVDPFNRSAQAPSLATPSDHSGSTLNISPIPSTPPSPTRSPTTDSRFVVLDGPTGARDLDAYCRHIGYLGSYKSKGETIAKDNWVCRGKESNVEVQSDYIDFIEACQWSHEGWRIEKAEPFDESTPYSWKCYASVSIGIEKPRSGSSINMNDEVRIQLMGAPEDRFVWILVKFKNGSRLFPQGDCNNDETELSVCRDARFGDPNDTGALLEITAVLVDPQGHEAYKSYVRDGFSLTAPPVTPLATSQPVTVRRI